MQAVVDEALEILGLGKNPSQAEVDRAKDELLAFFACNESDPHGLKELSKRLSARVSISYEKLAKSEALKSTTSGDNKKDETKPSSAFVPHKNSKSGLFWFIGIACVLGVIVIGISAPKISTDGNDEPTPKRYEPSREPPEPRVPEGPPEYAQPYIHSDISSFVTSWVSGTKLVDNVNRTVVRGMNSRGTVVNELIFYSDNGTLRLLKQYIVRRDPTGSVIAVQRFVPGGGSAAQFKNGSNVSPSGDVHQQTTFYKFDSYHRLQRVQVDTPFVEGVDGLTFDRGSGSLLVTRDRSPGEFRMNANSAWLDKFDLWDVFGQDN